jgi:hypothetical protein
MSQLLALYLLAAVLAVIDIVAFVFVFRIPKGRKLAFREYRCHQLDASEYSGGGYRDPPGTCRYVIHMTGSPNAVPMCPKHKVALS